MGTSVSVQHDQEQAAGRARAARNHEVCHSIAVDVSDVREGDSEAEHVGAGGGERGACALDLLEAVGGGVGVEEEEVELASSRRCPHAEVGHVVAVQVAERSERQSDRGVADEAGARDLEESDDGERVVEAEDVDDPRICRAACGDGNVRDIVAVDVANDSYGAAELHVVALQAGDPLPSQPKRPPRRSTDSLGTATPPAAAGHPQPSWCRRRRKSRSHRRWWAEMRTRSHGSLVPAALPLVQVRSHRKLPVSQPRRRDSQCTVAGDLRRDFERKERGGGGSGDGVAELDDADLHALQVSAGAGRLDEAVGQELLGATGGDRAGRALLLVPHAVLVGRVLAVGAGQAGACAAAAAALAEGAGGAGEVEAGEASERLPKRVEPISTGRAAAPGREPAALQLLARGTAQLGAAGRALGPVLRALRVAAGWTGSADATSEPAAALEEHAGVAPQGRAGSAAHATGSSVGGEEVLVARGAGAGRLVSAPDKEGAGRAEEVAGAASHVGVHVEGGGTEAGEGVGACVNHLGRVGRTRDLDA
eukprot:148042-Hanusia_phi.AAC.2